MSGRMRARVLADLKDEQLVSLSEHWGFAPARAALVLRHHRWVTRRIGRLAAARGLDLADIEDVKQMTHFILINAIQYFHTAPGPRRGPFTRYLGWFTRRRALNEIKKVRVAAGHYERSAVAAAALHCGHMTGWGRDCRYGKRDDPARLAEQREIHDLLESIQHQLAEPERTLLEYMIMKATIREIAAALAVSESTAKRWRNGLRAKLRPAFRGYLPLLHDDEL